MSMPSSRITAMASGRTWLGWVPALSTSKRSPASWRNNPSAIWLRAEFPVQRMRTRLLAGIGRFLGRVNNDDGGGIFGKRWHQPPEKQRGGHRAGELRD